MSDIELVIKIPEEDYNNCIKYDALTSNICKAIQRGIPLPKGHGRLIDADDVTDFEGHYITTDAPTIIEADVESEK